MTTRLIKYVARAGVASRRQAEQLIRDGKIRCNGKPEREPGYEVQPGDKITYGSTVLKPEEAEYFLLHKPLGVISTARDTHHRPTVVAMVPAKGRLYPVGRLDADTTGLIMITNDGELANRLTHPKFEVPKTYRVTVWGKLANAVIEQLRRGVELDDGLTAPAKVTKIAERGKYTTLDITIHEGRNRQVRRMCTAVGCPVMELARITFGPLKLGELPTGQCRRLTVREITKLRELSAPSAKARSGR